MKTYLCGYTNAGNIAVKQADWTKGPDVDCNGGRIGYVLVVKTGEWVKWATFPDHVAHVQICAENAHAAAEAFAGCKFDDGLGELRGWEIQRADDIARNKLLCDAFVKRFAHDSAALTIGQLKARLTEKQFESILRHAREGYSCNSTGGDPFDRAALIEKLKSAVRLKKDRREEWKNRMARLKPRFGYILPGKWAKAIGWNDFPNGFGSYNQNTGPMRYYWHKLAWRRHEIAEKKAAALAKRREPMRRLSEHIARFYRPDGLSTQLRAPRYGFATASQSAKGRHKFYTVAHARPGVTWEKDGIYYHPIRGAKRRKIGPRIGRELKKRIDLNAHHPAGLFAARLADAPDYVACYDASKDKKAWQIVGYAFKGHLVPESVVRGTVTLDEIAGANSDELKRIMIERYGTERYLRDIGAQPLHTDDWGTLYDLGSYRVVRMVNSTVEPDGSAREYFRAVPNTCVTARAAIAWTYNLTEDEYFTALTAQEAAEWMS